MAPPARTEPEAVDAVVLGGGIGGLVSAHRLASGGLRTLVLEQSPGWGGLARSLTREGIDVEVFYHHYFTHDSHVLNLIAEMGLSDRVVFREVRQAVLLNGRVYPFTTPLDLLSFGPIPFLQRLKLGLLAFSRSKTRLDGISVEEWVVGSVGREAYDRLFGPLILAKFGAPGSEISAAFARGRLEARGASRNRSGWLERLGYLDGGTQSLTDRLVAALQARGAELKCDSPPLSVERRDGGFDVRFGKNGDARTVRARHVVSTISTDALARLLSGVSGTVPEGLASVRYRSVAVACLGLDRSLSPYYWTSVADPSAPFNALIEHTRLHGVDRYGGRHVVYLGKYLDRSDAEWSLSDEELLARMFERLCAISPGLSKRNLAWSALNRDRYASPIFRVGYDRTIGGILEAIPGLFIGGTVRVYPDSRNVNSAVKIGEEIAARILASAP